LRFLHGYFSSGVLEDWQLVPDAPTRQTIARYGLLPRMMSGVFSLTACAQEARQFLRYLDGQDNDACLRFYLSCDPARFCFITDLAPDRLGRFALDSRGARAAGGDMVLRQDADVPADGPPDAIAVVSIRVVDLLANDKTGVSYVFQFPARKLAWDYYVINRSGIKLADPVIGNHDGYRFQGPCDARMANGERALRFHSGNDAFVLQQNPTFTVDLIDRIDISPQADSDPVEHCLIQGLPTPTLQQVNPECAGGGPVLSCSMHVYV
jgi:hypothetical protein